MSPGVLNARLRSAADFVRQGAVFADIGTDHAHLPLFLLKEGRIKKAFCADINKGPLDSARKNAQEAGYTDMCEFVLCNGASALADKGIEDYAVCGMGGELIVDIISAAPHLHKEGINLILQPMSKPAPLREYLYSHGFDILCEAYSVDKGKPYVCMNAIYTGEVRAVKSSESELGLATVRVLNTDAQKRYLLQKKRSVARAIDGIIKGGGAVVRELDISLEIIKRLEKIERKKDK